MAVARYSARLVRNMLMRRLPAGGKPLQRLSLLRETLSGISISTDHSVDGVVSSKRRGFSERSTLQWWEVLHNLLCSLRLRALSTKACRRAEQRLLERCSAQPTRRKALEPTEHYEDCWIDSLSDQSQPNCRTHSVAQTVPYSEH